MPLPDSRRIPFVWFALLQALADITFEVSSHEPDLNYSAERFADICKLIDEHGGGTGVTAEGLIEDGSRVLIVRLELIVKPEEP